MRQSLSFPEVGISGDFLRI